MAFERHRHWAAMARSLTLALALLLPATALADDGLVVTPEYFTGTETPAGFYGLGLDVQPVRWLAVAAGLGWSHAGNSSQWQLELAPRLRWPVLDWLALSAGATLSMGKREHYQTLPGARPQLAGPVVDRTWSPGFRLGPEIGIELAPLPRGRLRLYAGMAFPLDRPKCWVGTGDTSSTGPCDDARVPEAGRADPAVTPYFGLALGWTAMSPPGGPSLVPAWRWYGWQMLVVDGWAGALVVAGNVDHASDFRYAASRQGLVLFFLDGPVIHLTHRRPLAAALSLILRGGLVVGAGLAGLVFWDSSECLHFDCASRRLMVAGGVLSSLVDAAFLAHEPAP
jgi:hypothetical protein